ncbi:tRNA preQ1(34) S-adenosylmethionine ribosyltransferase-isomerase QueA [bacterium]|nr:tRNA preQ1(34) S-adenosylmethionine ribosyltransferase-isomerase QueA [bacterium]
MDRRSAYIYSLPERLIAQEPLADRTSSRLLVLPRRGDGLDHALFHELPNYMRAGDVLVLNNTRVIPARLQALRPTGGRVELLLLRPDEPAVWHCLAKPAKRVRVGEELELPGARRARVMAAGEDGRRKIRIEPADGFDAWLEDAGSPPLPPYIQRDARPEDRGRYQTVYAEHNGAVAAPTAGLHFTRELLDVLREKGVNIVYLTLHVGIGTFRPVSVENLDEHEMDYEQYEVSEESASALNGARKTGGRIVAVGTTVVRTLETVTDREGIVHPGRGETNLFIRPPYDFKAVDALITNFHLPGSTLIMLVSALAGRERVLDAYREAVAKEYRFFSYGDAMLIM